MQSKALKFLPKLILPSDDPGEKRRNSDPCTECKGTKIIIRPVVKVPCPSCSPTPEVLRSYGL